MPLRVEGNAMRHPFVRFTMLTAAILALGAPEALACSGPGAAKTIRDSILIGWSLWAVSLASVVGGRKFLLLRSYRRPVPWLVASLAFHPVWWMSATRGDCGFGLRFWSVLATLWIAIAVALATCWPRPSETEPKKWKWVLSGALVGALAALPIAALILLGSGPTPGTSLTLAGAILCSILITGTLVGAGLFRRRTRDRQRFTFSLRTLLLLPLVLAPLFIVLLPVLPYEASVSITSPFSFVVVDDATGRPIPNAAIQLIDPRFAPDDTENQGQRVTTEADGSVGYFLSANVNGREGLLGRTETISYNPWLIRVEAAGYQPFFASLSSDPPIPRERLAARPLGLTFPPPPSVTIRLSPNATAAGREGKWGQHSVAP